MSALATYLYAAMVAWMHLPADCEATPNKCHAWERLYAEPAADAANRYIEIAGELADEAERRGGTRYRQYHLALELAALAVEESKLSVLIDNATCNVDGLEGENARRCKALGGSDSGRAWGLWQVHPDLVLDVAHGIEGADLVADRTLEIRIAWDLLLVRPSAWMTWNRAARRAAIWELGHPI